MNDLQIDYFMAVATNLSFTKTSEELFVSQPAISRQIKDLETELGVKLFYRNNKETRLTEAGKMFYDYFSKHKIEMRNLQLKAAAMQKKKIKQISIGFVEGWDLSFIIPEILEEFGKEFSGVEVSFECCGVKELSTLLLTGQIDLALLMKNGVSEINEIKCTDVFELDKVLVYSVNNRFSEKKNLKPEDFKDEKFIAPWGVVEKKITRIINQYCAKHGFVPQIRFVSNNETMITHVRNNLGVAFSDRWTWALLAEDLKYLELGITDTISVAMIEDNQNEAAHEMALILENVVKKNGRRQYIT